MTVFRFRRSKSVAIDAHEEVRKVSEPAAEIATSANPLADIPLDTEFVLGRRQESINGFFDQVSQAMQHLQALHVDLKDKQTLLISEFFERGRERAEFMALANAYNSARDHAKIQLEQQADLRQQLSSCLRELEDKRHALTLAEQAVDNAHVEIARQAADGAQMRAELSHAMISADHAINALNKAELERDNLSVQINEIARQYSDLESQWQAQTQARLSADAEREGVQKLYDEAITAEIALSRRIAELEEAAVSDRQALLIAEERLRSVQANFTQLSIEHEEAIATNHAQTAQDALRLETSLNKLRRIEQDNAAMSQQILAQNELARTHARRLSDTTLNEQRLSDRLDAAVGDLDFLRQDFQASEKARLAAVERGEQLSAVLDRRKLDIDKLEGRCEALQALVDKQNSEMRLAQAASTERERQMAELVERARGENAALSGALDEARRERNRMIAELQTHLNSKTDKASLPPSVREIINGASNIDTII